MTADATIGPAWIDFLLASLLGRSRSRLRSGHSACSIRQNPAQWSIWTGQRYVTTVSGRSP
jgi:hypothetical protein